MQLHVATYNIHKGFSHFNLRMALHEIRDRLRETAADLVFLQEVIGGHLRHANRYQNWPDAPQYEFLADSVWPEFAYGRNAVYDHGHHGNAILSRYPITRAENQDVSSHVFERRGLLYCEIALPGARNNLHCMCVHLALHERGRRHQVAALVERVQALVPAGAPLIIAGDFNDWRGRAGKQLAHALGLQEALRDFRGRSARTFPSGLPFLRLDRIYVRGLSIEHAATHSGLRWSRVSDHALLTAQLVID